MKRFVLFALAIACISCTGGLDPQNFNPYGNNDPRENDNGGNNESAPTEDTDPTSSDVDVDDDPTSDDFIDNTQFDGSISIVFSEADASVSGSVEGVSVQKSGARVTVTNTGDNKVKYVLSGSSSDGFFKLYSSKKQAIVLNGLTLANTQGAAINNQSKKRTFVVVEGTNAISDGKVDTSGNYPEEDAEEDMKAAVFSEGQLVFSGTGTLKVTAVGKSGITSDDYIRFFDGPTINVTSAKGHGVRGKDAIIVSGGTVNVTLESTATGRKCFTTDSLMYIGGGAVTLVNNASAGSVDSELTGAAGIKVDQILVVRGGETTVTATGKGCKGISGDINGFFEGGTVVVKASGANYGSSSSRRSSTENSVSSKAIKFDGNLEFLGSEVAAACSSHEAIEAKGTIYVSAGKVVSTAYDDAVNSGSTLTISDGYVYAASTNNDGLDANGNLYIKGGTVFAAGTKSPEVGIDANTEARYKLYIQGGNVIAVGGIESGSSVSQNCISTSWKANTTYSLCSSDETLLTFTTPSTGGTTLFITTPSLVKGTSYILRTQDGSSVNVTASTYSSSGSGDNPSGPGRR